MTAWLLERLNTSNTDLLHAAWRIANKCQHDHGGCIKWVGGCNNAGLPVVSIAGRSRAVRTAIYEIVNANKPDHFVYIATSCSNKLCVNFEHYLLIPKKEKAYRALAALGKVPRTDVDADALRRDRDLLGLPYSELRKKYRLSYTQIIRRIGIKPLTIEKRKRERNKIEGITLTARDVLELVRRLKLPEENVLAALTAIRRKKRPC